MSTIDTDVDKYTISELLAILQLHELNDEDIMNKTNKYIDRFKNEKNYTLVHFFQNMQTKLLRFSIQEKENKEPQEIDDKEEIVEGFNTFE